MRLESVLELKLSLGREVTAATRRIAASTLSVGGAHGAASLPVAVGVARAGADARGYRLAVRLFDRSSATRRLAESFRERAHGEADVDYVGLVSGPRSAPARGSFRARVRPLVPGHSIAHHRVTAGTLGVFVTSGGYLCALSNNHVLANSNVAAVNDAILQPGKLDGGRRPGDTVGGLERFVRMRPQRNLVDAALAWIRADQEIDPLVNGRSVTTTRADVDLGDEVWKAGRTTGVTRGRVTAIALDRVGVDYSDAGDGSLIYSFDDQIEIRADGTSFSRGGDSGSLIVDPDDVAVGLLFAGSDRTGVTFANPIETVLARTRSTLLA